MISFHSPAGIWKSAYRFSIKNMLNFFSLGVSVISEELIQTFIQKISLIKQGEFIGNTPIIMSYINSLQNDKNG